MKGLVDVLVDLGIAERQCSPDPRPYGVVAVVIHAIA